MWLEWFRRRLRDRAPVPAIAEDTRKGGPAEAPRLLILSGSKRNQNYYRDRELARQTRSVFLTETFDFAAYDWNVERIAEELLGGAPDWIFLNYVAAYSSRLQGFERLGAPVVGFVGDHYNFLETSPPALAKQAFFRALPLAGMASAYPHTDQAVAEALGRPGLPFLYLPWAIDPAVFHDLGCRRRFDIACMGALTAGKYPFRRQVRAWLEEQNDLRLFGKKRVKGRGGSDHDGEAFNLALNGVRSAFTCASAMRYTLMKYFEIPAAGALLFGETTPELDALGFRDGEHYVAVTPENFQARIRHFLSENGRVQWERIRQGGHDFVRAHHTWQRRIAAFLPQVKTVLGGASR